MNAVRRTLIVFALLAAGPALCGAAAAESVTLPAAERVRLENGTVLILSEKHDVPLIAVRAMLKGGAIADPPGKGGLASLFAALLEKGAGKRNSAEFAEAIDSVGGVFSARAGLENISISLEFLSHDAELMVELLADALQRPALERSELGKLQRRMINFILAAKDSDPGALMPIYGSAFLFGEHAYGNSVAGSEASLAAVDHQDLLRYYKEQIGADRLVISVSGDFDTAQMRAALTSAFGDWRPAGSQAIEARVAALHNGRKVLLIDKPGATQTYFWIANVGVAMNFERRADLDLVNTVFGGRFTSMLNTALRIESGLTYGARSILSRPAKPGSVAISSYTRTEATVEAIDMALAVFARLKDEGVAENMIDSARNYVLGQYPTRLETAAQLAAQFAVLEANGLDAAHIDGYGAALTAVTAESATAVIDEVYPSQENLVFVILGEADAIRDAVQKYGPVSETTITEPSFRLPEAGNE